MKRNCGLATVAMVGVLLAAGWVGAAGETNTQNTVSAPAGFLRLVLQPQTNVFAAMPFVATDPGIGSVLSNALTGANSESAADRVQKWDVSVQQYTNAYKYTDGAWYSDFTGFGPSDMSFHPGEGFFIQNRQATTQTVFLCGKVVLDGISTQTMASGYTFLGYPYPTAIRLNDTSLAADGAQAASSYTNSDHVSTWDSIQSQYSIFDSRALTGSGTWLQTGMGLPRTNTCGLERGSGLSV